jgi:hypothetical protein
MRFRIEFISADPGDPPAAIRIRKLLKAALRSYGLRVLDVRAVDASDSLASPTPGPTQKTLELGKPTSGPIRTAQTRPKSRAKWRPDRPTRNCDFDTSLREKGPLNFPSVTGARTIRRGFAPTGRKLRVSTANSTTKSPQAADGGELARNQYSDAPYDDFGRRDQECQSRPERSANTGIRPKRVRPKKSQIVSCDGPRRIRAITFF